MGNPDKEKEVTSPRKTGESNLDRESTGVKDEDEDDDVVFDDDGDEDESGGITVTVKVVMSASRCQRFNTSSFSCSEGM